MSEVAVLSQEPHNNLSVIQYKGSRLAVYAPRSYLEDSNLPHCELTGLELEMLKLLFSKPGFVWSKDVILQNIWPDAPRPNIKIIDVVICKIRGKLVKKDPAFSDLINTVWGRGYVAGESKQGIRIVLPEQSRKYMPIPGRDLTIDDLPPTNSTARWVISKKLLAVQLVAKGKITLEQLLLMYPSLSEAEFLSWQNAIARGGAPALRITYSAKLL